MKNQPQQIARAAVMMAVVAFTGLGHTADESRDDKKEKDPHGDIKSLNGLTGRVTLSPGPGVVLTTNGNGLTISARPLVRQNVWKTTGNAGTSAGVNFLGTTDDQPLELKVNGQRVLRL